MKLLMIFLVFLNFICADSKNTNFIESKNFKIPVVAVKKEKISESKSYYAKLEADQSQIFSIVTRTDGFLQQLFVSQIYEKVRKNEALFTFYSPELIDAQSEYLVTSRYNHGHLARQKLELLGVNSKEIAKLSKGKILNEVTFYSPIDGVIFSKNFNAGSGVKKGDEIFKIVNLDSLWVVANINQEDLGFIQTLDSKKLENLEQNTIKSYVILDSFKKKIPIKFDIIYPNVTNNFVQVRFILDNKNAEFFPNMFAKVLLESVPKERLILPKSAILQKNKKNYVFVASDDEFMVQEIEAKRILGSDFFEIIDGLEVGEIVAKNALFMLDSDAQNNGDFE
ncbi:HlyD family efflux transporter periplasmic adaptor subunit [Helicobacter saguini]|uniref:Efflux RND transporter periplasmic adaptor subunit n=1 Tax=Helicobacter saguini TaxID=1548018 RepID=A0A347W3V9_9HELI|nr:efflux RND transporter periplasmic adaptor subunit [Helicobacter saguini]MWV62088.1 HlyD family efflux transporter periplasmic adaptor subunit [Helicobacter saguini]MWV67239.1 HlyD family efflux transporter periplasmic adaptor subunit [Helicobacter saguini]MWV69592.1 HlyD family efflux transporter periplasmic adaptor subunit [Helicobacter saguini]MWV70858.1 HlyD family efflux transporter periplasmic adaptor subunit [Helicobacter saguini]TLD94308.1 efflux RND transporter periplasmic adaptor 